MADPSTADVQAELKEYLNSKNINRCVPGATLSLGWVTCYNMHSALVVLLMISGVSSGSNFLLATFKTPRQLLYVQDAFTLLHCFYPSLHGSLFIQIVERLLIEKPDNPIGFIVEYLAKRYPDETRAAKVGHAITQRTGSLASNLTSASR